MKIIITFILLVVFGIGAIGLLGLNYYSNFLEKPLTNESGHTFTITSGDSSQVIAQNLETEGYIEHKELVLIYLKLNPELATNIKTGEFKITKNMNIVEFIDFIQNPLQEDQVRVTIPEGLRLDEIANLYSRAFKEVETANFSKSDFLKIAETPDNAILSETAEAFLGKHKPESASLEGLLYPDTYNFELDATAEDVVSKMIETLDTRLTDEDISASESSAYSLYEQIIVASMIEREAFTNEEKADIADVIYKRLEVGVNGVKLLQIDATLLYGAKDWDADPFILKSVDNPFNTYLHTGLPPTPISNPGIAAIQAAIYPNENPYFFYIHDLEGNVHFATTQSEHDANVREYLF